MNWNLDDLYKGFKDPKYIKDFKEVEKLVVEFNSLRELIENDNELNVILKYIEIEEKLTILVRTLSSFSSLTNATDVSNQESLVNMSRLSKILNDMTATNVAFSRFLVNVWSQICLAFNNGYDEHLIFEVMNEPRLKGTKYEWWFDGSSPECVESAVVLNDLNQIALDTIRNSGGNNKKRFVSIPGLRADPGCAMNSTFKMPKDYEPGRLILSVHMYTPYNFAGESPGVKEFTKKMGSELALTFKNLNEKFIKQGYPVIIGEYGATNKDNLNDRVEWFKFFIKYSRKYGMTSCLWDNGQWDVSNTTNYAEHFGYYDRLNQTWFFPEILEAIMSEADGE